MRIKLNLILVLLFLVNNLFLSGQQFDFRNWSLEQGLPQTEVYAMLQDSKGNLWIGTSNAVSEFDGISFTSYTEDPVPFLRTYNIFHEDSRGNIWMGSRGGGIIQYRRNKFTVFDFESIINGNIVRSIFQDSDGHYWFGLSSAGLVEYDGNRFNAFTTGQFPDLINVRDIIELDNKKLLILTFNGLYIYDGAFRINNNKSKQFSLDNERLKSNQVHSLYKDKNKNIWIFTNNGISKYSDEDIISYTIENGLNTPITMQVTDVKLFFSEVDWKDSIFNNFRSGVKAWNVIPENLVLPHDSNHLSFDFEALSFMAPEKVRYQWRLDGIDKDWSPESINTEAVYPEIQPGDYIFQVKAMNNDGIWNTEPASFKFKIMPPWWKSSWFIMIFSLLAMLIFISVIQLRVRIIKAKKEELEELVREKTLEVVNKNQLLEQQKEEIQTQADNLQKSYNNLERLSEIGRIITSQLTVEKIVDAAYDSINELMDATVFGIGIVNDSNDSIDFYGIKEKGETIDFLSFSLNDDVRLSVYCVNHKKEVFINDFETEFARYLPAITPSGKSGNASSIIYLPLIQDKKVIGVITVQSFHKNAYSEYHFSILRNLAVYTKIALENTSAYKKIREQAENLIKANENISKKNIEIAKANEELIELNNEKNNLISILAHDLRNPLTSSLSIASNLENNFNHLKEDDRTSVNFLVGALNRMNDMIAKILDIRMIEQKKINLNCEKMDFEEVLKEVISNFKSAASRKKIKIQLESSKIYGVADRNYLVQVFENLLSNAIKFSPPNKKVRARLEEQDGDIRISFTDEGPGLTADDIKKLFKPFQRLSTQPTAGEKSIGLGLSIVKKYVDLMDGRVWCESEPGKGANFILTFPLS